MAKLRKDVVAVVHQIRVGTLHEHNTRLFVGDVPSEVGEHEIKDALEAAGHRFGEFKVAWANHYLVRLPEADPQVRGAWRRTEAAAADGDEGDVLYVPWSDLSEETDETEVLFLRVPAQLKSALTRKAKTENLSINQYCARVLASAAQTAPEGLQPA